MEILESFGENPLYFVEEFKIWRKISIGQGKLRNPVKILRLHQKWKVWDFLIEIYGKIYFS